MSSLNLQNLIQIQKKNTKYTNKMKDAKQICSRCGQKSKKSLCKECITIEDKNTTIR